MKDFKSLEGFGRPAAQEFFKGGGKKRFIFPARKSRRRLLFSEALEIKGNLP